MFAEEGWLCGECREWWDDEDSALDCCRPPEPECAWKCSGCYEVYTDEIGAEECCPIDEMDCD